MNNKIIIYLLFALILFTGCKQSSNEKSTFDGDTVEQYQQRINGLNDYIKQLENDIVRLESRLADEETRFLLPVEEPYPTPDDISRSLLWVSSNSRQCQGLPCRQIIIRDDATFIIYRLGQEDINGTLDATELQSLRSSMSSADYSVLVSEIRPEGCARDEIEMIYLMETGSTKVVMSNCIYDLQIEKEPIATIQAVLTTVGFFEE